MKYHITFKDNGYYIKFFGLVDNQTILEANYDIYGKLEFEQARFQILDLLDISDFVAKTEEAIIVGAMDKSATKWNSSMKVAVVTNHKSVIAYNNQYKECITRTNWECEVFDSLESAKHWINTN